MDSSAPIAPTENWQTTAGNALEAAKNVDRLLRDILTTSSTPIPLDSGCESLSEQSSLLTRQVTALSAMF
jgi:hypothetical protein